MSDESTTNGFTTAPATSEEDNLDYESEDDDDTRSNHSNNNNSNISTLTNGSGRARHGGGRQSSMRGEETKRSHHNVLERKRRDLLKDSFTKLRDSVPTTQPRERVSRAEILKQAADFIQLTVKKNANVRAELDELILKNQELEDQKKSANLIAPTTDANAPTEATIKLENSI